MNKQQALQCMKKGYKVTHRFFSLQEYIFIDKDRIMKTEEGYDFRAGFENRNNVFWQTDWSIYKEDK